MFILFFCIMISPLSAMEQASPEHKRAIYGMDLESPIGFYSEVQKIDGSTYNLYKLEDTKPGVHIVSIQTLQEIDLPKDKEAQKILIWWWIRRGQNLHWQWYNKDLRTWCDEIETTLFNNYYNLFTEELKNSQNKSHMCTDIIRIKSMLNSSQKPVSNK